MKFTKCMKTVFAGVMAFAVSSNLCTGESACRNTGRRYGCGSNT